MKKILLFVSILMLFTVLFSSAAAEGTETGNLQKATLGIYDFFLPDSLILLYSEEEPPTSFEAADGHYDGDITTNFSCSIRHMSKNVARNPKQYIVEYINRQIQGCRNSYENWNNNYVYYTLTVNGKPGLLIILQDINDVISGPDDMAEDSEEYYHLQDQALLMFCTDEDIVEEKLILRKDIGTETDTLEIFLDLIRKTQMNGEPLDITIEEQPGN